MSVLVSGFKYASGFVDSHQEAELLEEVDRRPWLSDLKRRVQHYGYKYDYKARAISLSMYVGPLPTFAAELGKQLLEAGIVPELPDQLIVNEYLPGQGISPHVDCVACFKDHIVTMSLGSRCEFELIQRTSEAPVRKKLIAERRSLILLSGEARYDWFHTIRARKTDAGIPRRRRVSLTFRKVILDSDQTQSLARNSYTGIGSRKTPDDVLIYMMDLATELEELGYILRSGAAAGADSAFECGVKNPDNAEIYLPWRGFEDHPTGSYDIASKAFDIAAIIHPAWDKLSQGARKLHARNIHQVLGADLDRPSKFVICWTPNGREVGGTRTAIVAARLQSIPVYNLADKLWSVKELLLD